jgi:hypothetical protein
MEMNEQIREHLMDTLKAYKGSIDGVEDFIKNHSQQLENAKTHKKTVESKIADLQELLGVSDEDMKTENSKDTTPEMKLV